MTKILKINPVNPEMDLIKEAAKVIKEGGTVAFPTETVYGIGADAYNVDACKRIFEIKGRPSDNPLIVHIAKILQLDQVTIGTGVDIIRVMKVLWPGPVTFILYKGYGIPKEVSAGLETIAVRMPAHPIALRLIEESGAPIAAPSANISKRPSATRASHVIEDLDGKVDIIIDGGDTAFGLESTIINATIEPYVLLRPGAFTIEELEKYLGHIVLPDSVNSKIGEGGTAIAPGMKYTHYAPAKKLIVITRKELVYEAVKVLSKEKRVAVLCSNEVAENIKDGVSVIRLGSEGNLYEIAKNLFGSFRDVDNTDADFALIQSFPERGIGLAIMNRILKASESEPADSLSEIKAMI